MSNSGRGDDVYQPANSDVQNGPDDELDLENVLDERDEDAIVEEGYSPPERPLTVEEFGTTQEEQSSGETLDRRLARELPDEEPPLGDGIGELADGDGEVSGGVGAERSGRLVADEADQRSSGEPGGGPSARDVGIDGGAASAEEAAVHTLPPDEET